MERQMYQIAINDPEERLGTMWQADLDDAEETMDLETARAMVHETIRKAYAQV